MNNIEIIKKTDAEGVTTEFVIINRGNGEFTSMLKSIYETEFGKVATSIVSEDE